MNNLGKVSGSPENRERALFIIEKFLSNPECRLDTVLSNLLRAISEGKSVRIIEEDEELTPQSAAKLLRVSRGFLEKLLSEGKIKFRKLPGSSHKRIKLKDLEEFIASQEEEANKAMDDLSKISHDMGLDY